MAQLRIMVYGDQGIMMNFINHISRAVEIGHLC
jgi:hypothetical protein